MVTRLAYLFDVASSDSVLRDFATLDSERFLSAAHTIAGGDWLWGREPFPFAPLYAYYLAAFSAVGVGLWTIYLSQLALAALSAWLLFRVASASFGRSAAVLGTSLWCLYGPASMLELKVMDTTLSTVLGLAAVYFLLPSKSGRARRALAGFLLGLECLARPNTLLLVPVAALWLATRRTWSFRRKPLAFRNAASFLLGVMLAIAPVTLRNRSVTGSFALISNQGGIAFYQGNNARAQGTYARPDGFSGEPMKQAAEARRLAEAEEGRALDPAEVDAHWYRKGLSSLASDLGAATGLWAKKLAFWCGSEELSVEYVFLAERDLFPSLWLVSVPFALLLGCAALGFRRRYLVGKPAILLVLLAANLASVVIFFFASRYRAPAVPALSVLAGAGLSQLYGGVSRPRIALSAAITALALFAWSPIENLQRGSYFFLLGNAYFAAQEYPRSVEYFERAARGNPASWKIRHNLGEAYGVVGRYEAAVDELGAAARLDPKAESTRRALTYYLGKLGRAN